MISLNREETFKTGEKIGEKLSQGSVVCLFGPLGSGKTLLTKGIAEALDISDEITSPTFTLISTYHGKCDFYHIDLYRIENEEELHDLGLTEVLYGDGISVVEWAEKLGSLLPPESVKINLKILPEDQREILLEGIDI
ncbi:MAG: tRNA (adenosine(37)-N6)-threonylcarbamoyltransferase complex ATPase subunit type 1 TsaE [Spirochaetales bacterium]|nr:tRNA (adenosine(37)-N6)-threonylcarbamoyltransferase complex ATPase subunit type 1 TsaE [Spirochaetales bacterium]